MMLCALAARKRCCTLAGGIVRGEWSLPAGALSVCSRTFGRLARCRELGRALGLLFGGFGGATGSRSSQRKKGRVRDLVENPNTCIKLKAVRKK